MSFGDREYPRASAVARPLAYPEASATGDALAGALRSAYSYGQHGGALVAQWMAPIRPEREPYPWILAAGGSTVRMLRSEVYIPEHFDELQASVWFAVRDNVIIPATPSTSFVDAVIRVTTTGPGDRVPWDRAGPAWPSWVDVPSEGLGQAVEARPTYTLSTSEQDSTRTLIVDLDTPVGTAMDIYPISCTVWGVTSGES